MPVCGWVSQASPGLAGLRDSALNVPQNWDTVLPFPHVLTPGATAASATYVLMQAAALPSTLDAAHTGGFMVGRA